MIEFKTITVFAQTDCACAKGALSTAIYDDHFRISAFPFSLSVSVSVSVSVFRFILFHFPINLPVLCQSHDKETSDHSNDKKSLHLSIVCMIIIVHKFKRFTTFSIIIIILYASACLLSQTCVELCKKLSHLRLPYLALYENFGVDCKYASSINSS